MLNSEGTSSSGYFKPEVVCHGHCQEGPKPGVEGNAATFDRNLWNYPQGYEVVHVGLKLKDGGTQELRLITVPSICEPLTAQPISLCVDKFAHLKQLDLADCSNGQDSLQIDILIGADYYWELVTGCTSRCEDGPVAVHTRLGWVLSGSVPKMKQSKTSTSPLITHNLHVGTALRQRHSIRCCTLSGSSNH